MAFEAAKRPFMQKKTWMKQNTPKLQHFLFSCGRGERHRVQKIYYKTFRKYQSRFGFCYDDKFQETCGEGDHGSCFAIYRSSESLKCHVVDAFCLCFFTDNSEVSSFVKVSGETPSPYERGCTFTCCAQLSILQPIVIFR